MQLHLILLSLTVAVALAAIVASPGLARRRLPSIFRTPARSSWEGYSYP